MGLGDRLIGKDSHVGSDRKLDVTQDFIRQRRRIWPWQLRWFRQTGTFLRRSAQLPVAEWPASTMVCNCLEITREGSEHCQGTG